MAALLRRQGRIVRKVLTRPPEVAPSRSQSLFSLVDNRERSATILLTIPSAGATLLTYRGALMLMGEEGAGLIQKGEALIFALSIGVLVWLGWSFLFSMLHRLRGKRLGGALLAGGLYVTTVAGIDAPFNMLALGGSAAVQISMVDTAAHYEKTRNAAFSRIAAIRTLVPGIRSQAMRFGEGEKQELKGANTGSPQAGKVSAAFSDKAVLLGNLAGSLETGLAQAEATFGDMTAALGRMKTHIHQHGPVRARSSAVSAEADRLDELLGRLAQFDFAASIKTTLASLTISVPTLRPSATKFEAKQHEQLAVIAEMTRTVAKGLQQAVDGLPAPPSKADPVRPANAMTAILTYWRPLFPQWLAALFIDLAPGLLLFILIAGRREGEAAERPDTSEGEA